jgi:hypothetical protein
MKVCLLNAIDIFYIDVREYRMDNQEWTLQINWQNWVHKTQDEDKQTQTNKQRKKNNVKVSIFNATFNNILSISRRSVLLVEGTGGATRKLSTSRKSPRNKQKKTKICVEHHYAPTSTTNNVNKA